MTTRGAVLGICAVVGLAAAMDLQVGLRGDLTPISEAEMAEAAAALRAARQSGDVLVHSPLLSVTELKGLGDLRAKPDVPRANVRATRRILVLDRSDARMSIPGRPESVERVTAHLELRRYTPAGDVEAALYDLIAELSPQSLHIERPPGTVKSRCTQRRAEGGFSCPGEAEWLYAAPRSLRIGGNESQCVWAHPTTGGALVFTLPAPEAPVPGHDLVLELSAGIADPAVTGTPDGAPVYVEVRQGRAGLGRLTVPNTVGWRRLEVSVSAGEALTLTVTTPRDGRRHHCLNARVLSKPRGAKK